MIKFKKFKIRNAEPFTAVDLDLDRKGLVRIKGRNGSGKSSLWHIFTYLFYDVNPNKTTKSDIMMSDKDFLIEAYIEINGADYAVAHTSKSKELSPLGEKYGSGYYLFKKEDDGWKDISWHKAKETQKYLKDLIGWSLEEWYGYVYLAQSTTHTLINGTPSERQKYLSSLFNLTPLDKIAEHYKLKAETLKAEAAELDVKKQEISFCQNVLNGYPSEDQLRNEITTTESQVASLQEQLRQHRETHRMWVEKSAIIEELNALSAPEGTIEGFNQEMARLLSLDAEASAVRKSLDELLVKKNAAESQLAAEAGQVIPSDMEEVLGYQDINLSESLARLQQLEAKWLTLKGQEEPPLVELPSDVEAILAYPDHDVAWLTREIQQIQDRPSPPAVEEPDEQELQDTQEVISTLKADALNLKNQISKLKFNSPECPTCGSTLHSGDREQKLADSETELQQVESTLVEMQNRIKSLEADRRAWSSYRALGPDRSGEVPELQLKIQQAADKKAARALVQKAAERDKFLAIRAETEVLPALKKQVADYEKKIKYQKIRDSLAKAETLRIRIVEITQDIDAFRVKLVQYPTDTVTKIAEIKANILALQKVITLQSKLESYLSQEEQTGVASHDSSDQIKALEIELNNKMAQVGQKKEHLEQVLQQFSRIKSLMLEVSEKESVYREQKKCEILAKNYGKAGRLRQLQLAKFSGYLEQALLCHTFKQLPEHRFRISVEDGIEIQTSKNGGRHYDVALMSGGEKGALSVAFLFALDDMLPANRKTSLKIVDEAEAFFDKERRSDFIEHTLPELRRRAETVVVISHQSVDDKDLFDRVWEVSSGSVLDRTGEVRESEGGTEW